MAKQDKAWVNSNRLVEKVRDSHSDLKLISIKAAYMGHTSFFPLS